ncbi:DUF2470 domain-containing protein [Rhizohabitans arisaemae]|uniref:DUF2470 domain-containing protein n=1 Tax=Rhizohabitans arisaemae TaxID=2720610 RepID=UPI0024B1F5C0|nr:DUF2470 domain-containing protein [Rhizohabitans arisaemae]
MESHAAVAERVRTLAADSIPVHVTLAGAPYPGGDVRGAVDDSGRPVLLVKPGETLHTALRLSPGADAGVTVGLTASRQLGGALVTRGMLTVQGWASLVDVTEIREAAITVAARSADEDLFAAVENPLDPDAPLLARVDVASVGYATGYETGALDAEDYLDAAPDPFSAVAERMLAHVNDAHRDQLANCLTGVPGAGPGEVWLWELDRHGATVRADLTRTPSARPTLIRFPWPTPAGSCAALEHRLRGLLSARA